MNSKSSAHTLLELLLNSAARHKDRNALWVGG